jgi:hypothetical protein
MHVDAQFIDSRLKRPDRDNIAESSLGNSLFPSEPHRLFARRHQRRFFEHSQNNKGGDSPAVPESLLHWLLEQHIGARGSSEERERDRQTTVRIANLPNSFWNHPGPSLSNDVDECFHSDLG